MSLFTVDVVDTSRGGSLGLTITVNQWPKVSDVGAFIADRYKDHLANCSWAKWESKDGLMVLDISDTLHVVGDSYASVMKYIVDQFNTPS